MAELTSALPAAGGAPAVAPGGLGSPVGQRQLVRVGTPPTFFGGFRRDMSDLWAYRELLVQLVRKELKVKYKESVLGFFWTLARPMLQIAIYYMAFTVFLGSQQPAFAVFVFTGLVAWQLFTDVVGGCTGTIVGNGSLIKKTYFPREVFPLSVVGAGLVNFLFQLVVLAGALVIAKLTGFDVRPTWDLLLVPLALAVCVVWATAIGIALAAATVHLRDLQYLIEVLLLAGFWLTPIVYPITYPIDNLSERGYGTLLEVYLLNPMVNVVAAFHRAFYTGAPEFHFQGNLWLRLTVLLGVGLVLLYLAQRLFARWRGSFAQEL